MREWVCNVCGYIHTGNEPPGECPLCGVGPEGFSLLETPSVPPAPAAAKAEKRWKCDICDYIHTGDEPPETCPLCGVGKEHFFLLKDEELEISAEAILSADQGTANAALDMVSYGLYIITSHKDGKINGQTANSVFQLTSQPAQIAICINKRNLTHEYIASSGVFAVCILSQDQPELVKKFGYQSGHTVNKFADIEYLSAQNGSPILKNCLGYLEAEVISDKVVDVGTHTIFVAKVTSGRTAASHAPLTYAHYRKVK